MRLYPFGMILRKFFAIENSETHEALDMDNGRKISSIDKLIVDTERQRIYFYDFDRASPGCSRIRRPPGR